MICEKALGTSQFKIWQIPGQSLYSNRIVVGTIQSTSENSGNNIIWEGSFLSLYAKFRKKFHHDQWDFLIIFLRKWEISGNNLRIPFISLRKFRDTRFHFSFKIVPLFRGHRDCGEKAQDEGSFPVCGDRATGYHYAATTCESCKVVYFFSRDFFS